LWNFIGFAAQTQRRLKQPKSQVKLCQSGGRYSY
jgi:hypothetical protein